MKWMLCIDLSVVVADQNSGSGGQGRWYILLPVHRGYQRFEALIPTALNKFAFDIVCPANRFDLLFVQTGLLPSLNRGFSQCFIIFVHAV